MNVVIIGGTSQVATELCLLLQERGNEVHPTVRSQVGASFYDYHDVDYRIVDITDQHAAGKALQDADVVVIAAFARQYARGFAPRRARKTNEQLIETTVRVSPTDATIVYLSSIAAFGDDVGYSNWDSYGREKRHAETVLADATEAYRKEGYAFRMGPIYGVNQDKTAQLKRQLASHSSESNLVVAVDGNQRSNVLHTVTLMDAIETVYEQTFETDVFTLVNEPPWTWRMVLEYYRPKGIALTFAPPSEESIVKSILQRGKQFIESRERSLRGISVYLPVRLNQRIFNEYVRRDVVNDLDSLALDDHLHLSQFDEDSAPGPRLKGLQRTSDLLSLEQNVAPMFSPEFDTVVEQH